MIQSGSKTNRHLFGCKTLPGGLFRQHLFMSALKMFCFWSWHEYIVCTGNIHGVKCWTRFIVLSRQLWKYFYMFKRTMKNGLQAEYCVDRGTKSTLTNQRHIDEIILISYSFLYLPYPVNQPCCCCTIRTRRSARPFSTFRRCNTYLAK